MQTRDPVDLVSRDMEDLLTIGLAAFMLYAPLALIPYWIAVYRKTVWRPFVFWWCLLLAWTVTGWIVALIMALCLERKPADAPSGV